MGLEDLETKHFVVLGLVVGLALISFFWAYNGSLPFSLLQLSPSSSDVQFGVYSDAGCTSSVSKVDWGTLQAGSSPTYKAYVKNTGKAPFRMALSTTNWNPSSASQYIAVSWDYANQEISPNGVQPVTFNLKVSPSVAGVSSFNFDIVITTLTDTYALTLQCKDQVGNPLPASVYFNDYLTNCDKEGIASYYTYQKDVTVNVKASTKVGERTFEASNDYLLSQNQTQTLTISRRFHWRFVVQYTDGEKVSGTLKLTNKETIEVPISNGAGEGYLLDGTYKVTFYSSPEIDLGTITVTNDQTYTINLTKEPTGDGGYRIGAYSTQIEPNVEPQPSVTEQPKLAINLVNLALLGAIAGGVIIAYMGMNKDETLLKALGVIVILGGVGTLIFYTHIIPTISAFFAVFSKWWFYLPCLVFIIVISFIVYKRRH